MSTQQKGKAQAKRKGMVLSQAVAETEDTTVTWRGHEVDVTYRPGALTVDMSERLEDAMASGNSSAVKDMIVAIIASWDVLDDDETPLPVTPETVSALPLPFLMAMLNQVQAAMRPPAEKG